MKTQISTFFSLDCQKNEKEDRNFANKDFRQKRQLFLQFSYSDGIFA